MASQLLPPAMAAGTMTAAMRAAFKAVDGPLDRHPHGDLVRRLLHPAFEVLGRHAAGLLGKHLLGDAKPLQDRQQRGVGCRGAPAGEDGAQTLAHLSLRLRIQRGALLGDEAQQPRGHQVHDAVTHQSLDDLRLRVELAVLDQGRELRAILLDGTGEDLVEHGSTSGPRVDNPQPGVFLLVQDDASLDQQVGDRRGAQRPPRLGPPARRPAFVVGQQQEDLSSGVHVFTVRVAACHRSSMPLSLRIATVSSAVRAGRGGGRPEPAACRSPFPTPARQGSRQEHRRGS